MNLVNYTLADFNNEPFLFTELFEIFKVTLNPDLTLREFNQYIFGVHPESFEASFIYENEELAGFCTAGAYPVKIGNKKVIVFRSAFGFVDKFKKGRFPLQALFYKYIRYRLRHPLTPVYVTGFMANPLMYAMICKYTLECYPRRDQIVPPDILAFKTDLLKALRLTNKELRPFVMRIHFQVQFKAIDLRRIEESDDFDVRYFLSINPGYSDKQGVLVLIPVTFPNIIFTIIRFTFRKIRKSEYLSFFTNFRLPGMRRS